jgi:hypothetical protein
MEEAPLAAAVISRDEAIRRESTNKLLQVTIQLMLNLHAVKVTVPEGNNIILGQSHFIKTVEDVYEALTNSVPGIQFGVAFNEASGPCLTRSDGSNASLRDAAVEIATAVGAGHFFAIVLGNAFPINVLRRIQDVPEVCSIFCATANPVEVIVAETQQGRGVLGVIDGFSPKGVEGDDDIAVRHALLRKFGYKR